MATYTDSNEDIDSNLDRPTNQKEHPLKFLPNDAKTEELCRLAVTKDDGLRQRLKFISNDAKTEEICRLAIAMNGL